MAWLEQWRRRAPVQSVKGIPATGRDVRAADGMRMNPIEGATQATCGSAK
jgi:hypothetical protein